MAELLVLQAARLKGRINADVVAAYGAIPVVEAQTRIDALLDADWVKQAGASVRITPEGRERLAELLSEERSTIAQTALQQAYHEFDDFNSELKAIVTAWQMKDGETPNDHTDSAYDQGVITRLAALHERFAPLLARIAAAAPRLASYPGRFGHAIDQVQQGDHSFVARPITDSYHTVWFELHEELIGLLGLSRADEAAAGRAV
ncbi:hypothetical protein DIZ27_34680 [Streptomyces sp. NWU339]|uniref:hypothetical protein n=1 Tax=Streptomyces sp. NWU339 TaxID=2185284 RepID=UPI000D678F1C|nr:hypothetical protein [Streptomyces sp. NWU339]PWI06179.1 hypothetical protein DIZ27_34680 [Streptomyces sp. NWU339]